MAKKETGTVTMRLRIGENELEVTGPSDFVEKKIDEFRGLKQSTSIVDTAKSAIHPITQISSKSTKKLSAAQFFKKISPKNNADRLLVAGFFLEKYMNEEKYTAAELSRIIRSAKAPPPLNPNDVVNRNIRKGYMMVAGDKDGKMAFVLTSDGEEAIEALLNS